MRFVYRYSFVLCFTAACFGQNFEFGAAGGLGFSPQLNVTGPTGTAKTELRRGPAVGVSLTQHMYEHISGELGYTFRSGDFQVSSGSQAVPFRSMAHSVYYDVLVFGAKRRAAMRPFISAGGGGRYFIGTGTEQPFQPLSTFVLLTKTREWKPLGVVGAGIQVRLARHVSLDVRVRDFATPAPKNILTPAPGANVKGWIHDITPTVGISYRFEPKVE